MGNEAQKTSEDLTKSIDSLLEELFTDNVEKSIDIKGDAPKTADEALKNVPGFQKDESRGAGRPKQISDVPQNDQDGKREGEYDGSIASKQSEEEPEEASQSKPMDQSMDKDRPGEGASKAPQGRPFKKGGEELTEEEYKEFEEFRKAKIEAKEAEVKAEELKKAEQAKKDQETLIKSAITEATESLLKENEELRKSFNETAQLLKSMAAQPVRSKSVTGIEALEKSERPEEKQAEVFTKSDLAEAAFELAKSGKISDLVVSEIEMTGRCSDAESRRAIEKYLESK